MGSPEVVAKVAVLWVTSLLWNLKKNEFDLFALRRGICIYGDLSHWSMQIVSWSVLMAVKKAMIAYPFCLEAVYIANIPTFMYLLKQLAAKIVPASAMQKMVILEDNKDFFKYAEKRKTPTC